MTPYRSFWMAGFEGADHVNAHGDRLDLVRANGHLDQVDDDYRRVAALGIRTIRESIGWRLCEPGQRHAGAGSASRFDFTRALRFAEAADRHGLQVLWTLMHYGRPADTDVFEDGFAERFADFAAAAARALGPTSSDAPIYTPVNEISFLAWAIAESDLIHPYRRGSVARQQDAGARLDVGWEAKWRLVNASLRAIEAIRAEDPRARFLHVEPLIHVVPPSSAPQLVARAEAVAAYQWQAWDMLAGRLLPELGGSAAALDLLGVNYYHTCQWEMDTGKRLEWHLDDPRRVSLASLLRKAWKRYQRPLIVSETSHVGSGRARWLEDVAAELERAIAAGVPVHGACLYPIVDRPDWNDAGHWHRSGLWDVDASPGGAPMQRVIDAGYARSLGRAQKRLPGPARVGSPMRHLIAFSHQRWSNAHRRAQHLLSRLAKDYQVVFVEAPVACEGEPYLERSVPCRGVEVLRPHTPVDSAGGEDQRPAALQRLLTSYLADHSIDDFIAWLDTPSTLPMLGDLAPSLLVYDGGDEVFARDLQPAAWDEAAETARMAIEDAWGTRETVWLKSPRPAFA